MVVHDCGTVPFVRGWLTWAAHRQGRAVHLLILDVDPATARAGQQARGRAVSAREFARHRAVAARALTARRPPTRRPRAGGRPW
ncbi:hypothetical protein ACU686_00935 [Yinghuangia aomiensis]